MAESLGKIPGDRGHSGSTARGRAWGEHVANLVLNWRAADGFNTPLPGYLGGPGPGVWRSVPTPTNPDGTLPAIFPQMAVLLPFAMNSPSQFRPGPPPALSSAQYAADLNEVKAIGRFDSDGERWLGQGPQPYPVRRDTRDDRPFARRPR